MNRARGVLLVLAGIAVVATEVRPVQAWWPIAHYEITKQAAGSDIALYAQLPDYVRSWLYISGMDVGPLNPYFCWGHAVQDAGESSGGIGIAVTPHYPDDGRYPGPIMWMLANAKLTGLDGTAAERMRRTAQGFCAHNAADRIVHFDYFLGPHTSDWLVEAATAWLVEHQYREKWADYWVFIQKNHPDPNDNAFHDGALKAEGEYDHGVPMTPLWDQVAEVMRMAQLVYRKNRRSTRTSDSAQLAVQSPREIVSAYDSELLQAYGNKAAFRFTYTYAEFVALDDGYARMCHWSMDDLKCRYDNAVSEVTRMLGALETNQ